MSEDPSQPRPPRNLPDLLRYSIEAAQTSSQPNMTNDLVPSSSGPVPMDEEVIPLNQQLASARTLLFLIFNLGSNYDIISAMCHSTKIGNLFLEYVLTLFQTSMNQKLILI